MYSCYCVTTGLTDAGFVFSFSFVRERDLCVRSVLLPQKDVKCG